MLNQSGLSETSVDIEKEKQDRLMQRQKSIERSLQLNVKEHMQKLEVSNLK